MKATKRLISVLLISVMLLGCLTACGATQGSSTDSKKATNPVVLTFATEMATGTPEVQAAEIFAKNVYDKTNGEVEIQIYADGQLGEPATAIESTQLGNIDILILPASDFKSFDNIFGIEAIPFLYADNESVAKVLNESGAADMQKEILAGLGLIQLNEARNYFRGPYRVLASKVPVRTIDDLKGVWKLARVTMDGVTLPAEAAEMAGDTLVIYGDSCDLTLQGMTMDGLSCRMDDFALLISILDGEAAATLREERRYALVRAHRRRARSTGRGTRS